MKICITILFFFLRLSVIPQSFLNGSFELNIATEDQINFPNIQFNTIIENVFAYGTEGNMDLIMSSDYCGLAESCNWYAALTGGGTDAISMTLSEPLVVGQSYTISFKERACYPYAPFQPIQIGLSNTNDEFGTLIYSALSSPDYFWKIHTFSFIALIDGEFITISSSGEADIGTWAHVDSFIFGTFNSLGADTSLCPSENLVLNVSQNEATYLWQNGSTDSVNTVNASGVYWVDITNGGCAIRDSIIIDYLQLPIVDLGDDTSICNGVNLLLDANFLDATYLWQDNSTNQTFTVYDSGTYWVQASNRCETTSDTITINTIETPDINLGEDVLICAGASIQLNAETLGATSYLWQDGSTDFFLNASDEGTYWVEATFGNCKSTDSIEVNFYPTQQINLGADITLCEGEAINLSVSIENAIFNWSDLSTESTNTITTAGIYWIDVTIDNCTTRDSIEINFTPLPNLTLIADTALCENDVFNLDATAVNATYLWQNNSIAPYYEVNKQGIYWVKITINDCSITDSIFIKYNPLPVFSLGKDRSFCEGELAELKIDIPNATYLWQDNSTSSAYTTSQAGVYTAIATLNNCTYSDTVEVDFLEKFCNCQIFIPNSFTPNEDGLNDLFKASSNCPLTEFFIIIYNRWGEIVFTSDNINNGWNGATEDYYVPNEVYYWKVKSKISNESFLEEKSGAVTILR